MKKESIAFMMLLAIALKTGSSSTRTNRMYRMIGCTCCATVANNPTFFEVTRQYNIELVDTCTIKKDCK